MSSATSNRYQSRLFNFVYKRSQRLTKQLNRAWQNVTTWIMPVVSYPAQALHAAVHKSLPQLPQLDKSASPPTADTPVKNVLQVVAALPSDEELSVVKSPQATPVNFLGWLKDKFWARMTPKDQYLLNPPGNNVQLAANINAANINRQLVRGIASNISNRALVLVTPQNEILAILDNQQQQQLQARILEEVTQYWHYQRLLADRKEAIKQLNIPARQSLPVKLFSHLTTWLQIKGTLSESSDRSLQNTDNERQELIFATQQAIAFLDRSIAQFEDQHLAPVADNAPKTDKLQLQALIWAAIDYFFGDRQVQKISSQLEKDCKLTTTNQPNFLAASEDKIADPWLTLADLFGETKTLKKPVIVSDSPMARLPEDADFSYSNQLQNNYFLRSLFKRIQQKKSSAKLAKIKQQRTHSRDIYKLPNISQQLSFTREISTINSGESQSSNINHTPDWIEAEATTMGYIKHPLEQLLAWLDSAMLWLENVLVKIWQQLQKLLIGK